MKILLIAIATLFCFELSAQCCKWHIECTPSGLMVVDTIKKDTLYYTDQSAQVSSTNSIYIKSALFSNSYKISDIVNSNDANDLVNQINTCAGGSFNPNSIDFSLLTDLQAQQILNSFDYNELTEQQIEDLANILGDSIIQNAWLFDMDTTGWSMAVQEVIDSVLIITSSDTSILVDRMGNQFDIVTRKDTIYHYSPDNSILLEKSGDTINYVVNEEWLAFYTMSDCSTLDERDLNLGATNGTYASDTLLMPFDYEITAISFIAQELTGEFELEIRVNGMPVLTTPNAGQYIHNGLSLIGQAADKLVINTTTNGTEDISGTICVQYKL